MTPDSGHRPRLETVGSERAGVDAQMVGSSREAPRVDSEGVR